MALSLKYRPKKFLDLIGQDQVSNTLSLALKLNKVSHAYLFSGLRGSGKTSSARIFSRALQCENFPSSDPCNTCSSCKASLSNSHIDIIEMDAASSRSIDDIKNLIEQVQYRPAYGRFKIFIIDEIHMLTKEAFNALLKTLEEPPSYVKFILATTDPLKLPATILSRTQHFRFKKIPPKVISEHLQKILDLESIKFESSALDLISRNCGGSLRDALTILDQGIIFSKENLTLSSISSMLGALNPLIIEKYFESIFRNESNLNSLLLDFDDYDVDNVIDEMIIFLKDKFLSNDAKYNAVILDRFFRILSDAKLLLSINANSTFVLMLSTMKFKEALNIKEIDELIAELENSITPLSNKIVSNQKIEEKHSIESRVESKYRKENLFEKLINKIYDRDYSLGEIFKNNIFFISFENDVLIWESNAKDAAKATLREAYPLILKFVKEIFGEEVVVKSHTTPSNAINPSSLSKEDSNSASFESRIESKSFESNSPSSIESRVESNPPSKPIFLETKKEENILNLIKNMFEITDIVEEKL